MFDARRDAMMRDERAKMTLEERQVAAAEQIADTLYAIHTELQTLRLEYQAQNRGGAGGGRR